MSSIHFGTGGWRAIIGDDFIKSNIQALSRALARKMKDEGVAGHGFVVGYDRRFLSKDAAIWVAQAMAAEGIVCRLITREAPTPLVMFTVKNYGMDYGMAITASHNPYAYNGIKVFIRGGRDADEATTADIEARIDALAAEPVISMDYEKARQKGLILEINPTNEYIDSIIQSVDMNAIRAKDLHVVLDPMYGVSRTSLSTILLTARCDVDVIHDRHDTLFGGRLPAPSEMTLSSLRSFVLEHHCDIGLATDGDADRIGVVDEKANFLHPNQILVLLYYYLLKYKGWHGPAVRNLATTHLLDKVAAAFGEACYEVPVGFKHISAKMLQTNALIGGESSGGLTVRGHIQGKDGIYAAALLVEMLAVTGQSLSEIYRQITDEFGSFFMAERDYRFPGARKAEIYEQLMEKRELPEFGQPIDRISYQDGCKVYFQNGGWIICRFSGTEPLIRIFCEQDDMGRAQVICDVMKEFLKL